MKYNTNKLILFLSLLLLQITNVFTYILNNKEFNYHTKRSYSQSMEYNFNIYFEKPNNWTEDIYAYVYTDYVSPDPENFPAKLNEWPGYKMSKLYNKENVYIISYFRKFYGGLSHIIFSDGEHQSPGVLKEGFPLVRNAYYTIDGIQSLCPQYATGGNRIGSEWCGNYAAIYYFPDKDWYYAYAHYKIGNGNWTEVPGHSMSRILYGREYVIYIDAGNEDEITVAFNNGDGQWDNNDYKNYKVKILDDKVIINKNAEPIS